MIPLSLVFHELIHLSLSLLIGFYFSRRFRSPRLILISILIGVFIDVDHWYDYFKLFGFRINLVDFFNLPSFVSKSDKIYVLLHGWEFIPLFFLLAKYFEKGKKIHGLSQAVAFSYLGHLIWDNFSFPHHLLAYSFLFRLLNKFSLTAFNGI